MAKSEKAVKTSKPRTAAKKTGTAGRRVAGKAGGGAADLRTELRSFASARPEGWDHDDWLTFLEHLGERGHDTADAEGIGRQLERERLAVVLGQVRGLGPKRVEGLVNRFDTLWSMRRADVDEIAAVPGMNRTLAEKVRQQFV